MGRSPSAPVGPSKKRCAQGGGGSGGENFAVKKSDEIPPGEILAVFEQQLRIQMQVDPEPTRK